MIVALSMFVLCQLIGETLARLGRLPVPGPVIGMVLLFLYLAWRGRVAEPVRQTARGMLTHLSLLFVPAGTGVMLHIARLRAEWLPVAVALTISTMLTLIVAVFAFLGVSRLMGDTGELE